MCVESKKLAPQFYIKTLTKKMTHVKIIFTNLTIQLTETCVAFILLSLDNFASIFMAY